jgi:4-amino-4-deoxy-L-arabinose transferase-like glycosyltransferase
VGQSQKDQIVIPRVDGRIFLRYALIVGLLVRLAILWRTPALGTEIVDEQQFRQIALNLLAGDGFGWGPGNLTSIRPPLYPGVLAAVWAVTGPQDLQVVRALQIVLALATTALVFLLGARVYDARVGRYAAALCWLYPSFIFFNFLLLTETLFTFLLVAWVLLAVMLVETPRTWIALLCGISLALGALTRSLLWPVPLLLCPLLAVCIEAPLRRRLELSCVVLAGYVVVIAPWAVRNTRLQQTVTIVDTMGGMNLRMGNYEYTPDDRMWDAVSLTGEKSWVYGIAAPEPGEVMTEGRKEKWAQRKALEYIRANPLTTLRRSFIKFADFWGLEREFIAGVHTGLFAPPRWFQVAASLLLVTANVLVLVVGGVGMWLAPPRDWRLQALLLLPIALFVAAHSIIFGHSRYHLPLVPIFVLYATQLVVARGAPFRPILRPAMIGAAATVAVLLAIWIRQVVLVDSDRIAGLLRQLG